MRGGLGCSVRWFALRREKLNQRRKITAEAQRAQRAQRKAKDLHREHREKPENTEKDGEIRRATWRAGGKFSRRFRGLGLGAVGRGVAGSWRRAQQPRRRS